LLVTIISLFITEYKALYYKALTLVSLLIYITDVIELVEWVYVKLSIMYEVQLPERNKKL